MGNNPGGFLIVHFGEISWRQFLWNGFFEMQEKQCNDYDDANHSRNEHECDITVNIEPDNF